WGVLPMSSRPLSRFNFHAIRNRQHEICTSPFPFLPSSLASRAASPPHPSHQRGDRQARQIIRQFNFLQAENDERHGKNQQSARGIDRVGQAVRPVRLQEGRERLRAYERESAL